MRVTENRNPAAAPAGFTALEPVTYRVEVQGGTNGLTLQKIDYILNANSQPPDVRIWVQRPLTKYTRRSRHQPGSYWQAVHRD